MTSKAKLRFALLEIMKLAICHRDLAVIGSDMLRWKKIVDLAYIALDKPTLADIDRISQEACK